MKTAFPPKLFLRFFRWFCHPELRDYIEGDLMELYNERHNDLGKRKADLKFIIDVLLLFRPGIIKPSKQNHSLNNYAMFKSYFKVGWRNLLKQKGYSLINVGGLALGMAVAILIGLWIHDEFSYNKIFKNYDRIALVMQNQVFNGEIETWSSQAMQLGPAIRNDYSNHFEHVVMVRGTFDHKLTFNNNSVRKMGAFMDTEAPEMLSLQMLKGTRSGLKDPYSILLSESSAKAIFGDVDALDKIIKYNDKTEVKVTGIYKDIPYNCDYADLEVILPFQLTVILDNLESRVGWGNSWFRCMVQLKEGADINTASNAIKDVKYKGVMAHGNVNDDIRFKPELFLHPMSKWRLYSDFKNGVSVGGAIKYVWMFGVVGTFVLILACINFMNLSTARSEKRAKEVGIRKTVGSIRSQLISQFFTESLLIAFLAFVFSLLLVQLSLPWFNEVSNKHLTLLLSSPLFWMVCISFTITTGLIAGSYPALYLSSFKPIRVLKGALYSGRSASIPRKVLVVVQFTVSVTLIIGTIIVYKQIQFAQNRPIGYNVNGIISAPIRTEEIKKHFTVFREELLKTGAVKEVNATDSWITETYVTNSGFTWEGKDPNMSEEFVTLRVTPEFGKTVDWQIVEGRDFSRDIASDTLAFIINESAARYMGIEHPVGETMTWLPDNGTYKIVGVVKDLVSQNPYAPVKQMIYILNYKRINYINMKLNPNFSAHEAIAKVESVVKKYDPSNPFEYKFMDEEFANKFKGEKRIAAIAFVVSTLAIIISCLGLLGLSSFVAEQRTKELGIRKILGASVAQLWQLLSKDFIVLVLTSCIIAIPLSFYFMNNWLMQYQYRITISWSIYALSGMMAILITLATVSFQTIRAAIANPVKSLRSE
ncbi:ABC transporter permease [Chryseosolibacter indicus]|uniref:ABC transporter permease n=1 Tax=Chryseosolibacter indicus TaxID=2782351 RepID=A0ABS5VTL8_9BACT|nr:ABC transporter permease [Chryseosolibacter indicus]MBT1704769.1 ABC transporter permease [Chryseosolibacter indicus]